MQSIQSATRHRLAERLNRKGQTDMQHAIFRTFETSNAARQYRRETGCGGWILVDSATGQATIFPPEMPPSAIFRHPIARGVTGELIGHG